MTFNGVAAEVTGWSDTSITCTVPVDAATGSVAVTNQVGPSELRNSR